jgi:hypothetical protein
MTEPAVGDFGYDPTLDRGLTAAPLPVGAVPSLSAYTVPLEWLPPVGAQGTSQEPGEPGTCTAWAGTYGLATYTQAKKTGTPPTTPDLQASPAYIYIVVREQAHASGIPCLGTSYQPYFTLLAAQGTFSMAEAPYVADCGTLWAEYKGHAVPAGNEFVMPAVSYVSTSDVFGMKLLLTQNCPIAYGTQLFTDWNAYRGTPAVYVGNFIIAQGKNGPVRHSMLIVGYSDVLGAWLIQNSQGTAWGDKQYKGFVWMDYVTFTTLAEPNGFYY